ncbi:ATPase involved in chromosome partitioning [Bernardetia litoralis DSM 6794]|uniref:ATPase involved in chromosome partitioning n=1 Tax=Bernardetia litoralis (strain ATCC 23117 / DSM 6794 / NBRC 15988 / NCIMB 1366 / Fx l1 / Sio-4) TaxID=880071 RepID=I4AKY7_BERLS|nr:ParA family protein [Bernardetia litoralis]AFM04622.1 ATPase involved in chromosome partitioning [Bernardetia litoralis DSM 6794]
MIISFISRKGGTGKTTNITHLATTLASQKKRVLLIETDTNYTLTTLRKMELFKKKVTEKDAPFQILGSTDESIINELKKYKKEKKYDYILVDSAGKTTDEAIRKLCLESDLVIVPTSLSQNDLLVAYQTIQDLKPAQEINKKLKIAILPNRIHNRTNPKTVENVLSSLKATIIPTFVVTKNKMAEFSTLNPIEEYEEIAKNIVSLLNK